MSGAGYESPTPELESAIIGAVLMFADAAAMVPRLQLTGAEFDSTTARAAWGAVLALHERGEPIDPLAVLGVLTERGQDAACPLPELTAMATSAARPDTLPHHAERLRRGHMVRRLRALGLSLADQAGDPQRVRELLELARGVSAEAPGERFSDWPDGHIGGYFEQAPPAVQWFARERLLAGRGHLLVGTGGSSKTRVLYHLAVGAVLGRLPWEWTIETVGSAALFLTEDIAPQVHRTMHALGAALKPAERALLVERLRVFPLAGRGARLLKLNGDALVETEVHGWMLRQLEAMPKPLAFVGIDPALGVTEGDELNQAHQRRLGETVDTVAIHTGACAVLVAHAAKGIGSLPELQSHSARGAGALTDALRAEFTLRSMTSDEARRFGIKDLSERARHVQMAATKGNDLPPEAFVPFWMRRGAGGFLEQVELTPDECGELDGRDEAVLSVLIKHAASGDSSLEFWRKQCAAAGLLTSTSEQAQIKQMDRIRQKLMKARLVIHGRNRGLYRPSAEALADALQ